MSVTMVEPSMLRRTVIRMGGGPRTYPGGVSKWQWKRMQAKKAKQLMQARLCRERQIYEMRKRAELKAAVSDLERPWEVVEKAPKLFSVSADEQVKVLADRFQKPGGFDLWSDKDGPQLFEAPDELPSARFFPKGVVHSIKPYRKIDGDDLKEGLGDAEDDSDGGYSSDGVSFDGSLSRKGNGMRFLPEDFDGSDDGEGGSSSPLNHGRNGGFRKNGKGRRFLSEDVDRSEDGDAGSSSPLNYGKNEGNVDGGFRKNGNGRRFLSEDVDRSNDGKRSSPANYRRNGLNVDGGMRKNGNGRKLFPKDIAGSGDREGSSPSLGSGRNGVSVDRRLGNKGSERRILSKYGDRSDESADSRLATKGNGRRLLSKDADRSNRMYSERVETSRKHRGSNSIAGRSAGKYTKKTSGYASSRVKDEDSEVYDMGLQQDGSYGYRQKSEQSSDSTSW